MPGSILYLHSDDVTRRITFLNHSAIHIYIYLHNKKGGEGVEDLTGNREQD